MVLIQVKTKFLQFCKKELRFFSEKGDPWGDLNAPETTSYSSFRFFLSNLIKDSNQVRITYAQNHFKSTFGSAYFISKNNVVKLAKPAEKEPRKESFPWDIGLLFVQPIKVHWYFRILNLSYSKWNYLNIKLWIFTKLLEKIRYFRLDLLRLNFICKMNLRYRNWKGYW